MDISEKNRIVISYRREDCPGTTGRIYDRLIRAFGQEAVFKDVDAIPLGVNFKEYLDSVISECDVLLVVIGDEWLIDKQGRRRLQDPRDFVRMEIESALERDIPVVPLLVNDVAMPSEKELPKSLKEFVFCNGTVIHHEHFDPDVDRLIVYLLKTLKRHTIHADEEEFSHWMTSLDYELYFEEQKMKKMFPIIPQGRNHNSINQYRAKFMPYREGLRWFTHHGFKEEGFIDKNRKYRSARYLLFSLQTFIDSSNVERYQATWIREDF